MIYADYNGSSPLHEEVIKYLQDRLVHGPYANPNAIHSLGKKMNLGLEKCRSIVAKNLGARSNQIIFNSGASEGISHIFHSVLDDNNKKVILTSGIEHSAVVEACSFYQQKGFQVETIKTLSNGQVDIDHLEEMTKHHQGNIAMCTIMAANNETGVIQPWQDIAKLCKKNEIVYFCDTTQYIGKAEFNFNKSEIDYAVLSGHKIGALIGSGCILVKDPTQLKPFIFGGGQERGKRGGTQNYLGAETLAIAIENFNKNIPLLEKVQEARERFEQNIKKDFPNIIIIGEKSPRLASTTLLSYPGIHGQAVQIELESDDIFVTTSSACSDNEPETSKVLKAMNINDSTGRGVVRISLCMNCCPSLYTSIENSLRNIYKKLKSISNY